MNQIEREFTKGIETILPEYTIKYQNDIIAEFTESSIKRTIYFEKGKSDSNELSTSISVRIEHLELQSYVTNFNPRLKTKGTISYRIGFLGKMLNDDLLRFERNIKTRKKILPINSTNLNQYLNNFKEIYNNSILNFLDRFMGYQGFIDWYEFVLNTEKELWLATWRNSYNHICALKLNGGDYQMAIKKWSKHIESYDKENFDTFIDEIMKDNY
ncbi:hypothetical protein IZU89_07865 [Cellulophaga lytica]|uniref:hypothetical protein n=1 Tax=Cellulophaga lytica TaxID=979 RepID=UPI0032E4E1A1